MLHKNKDNEAIAVFEILVRENQDMLMTYLRAVVRDKSIYDDLFQETMLVVWQKLADYDRSRPFGPWLRGIAGKIVLAHLRKAKNDALLVNAETLEYLSGQLHHISENSGDTWDEKTEVLTFCIKALPDNHRQAVKLRYFQQMPVSNIAETTKTSTEAIKKRLQRARSQLLDCLRRKNVVMEITS
ncbi:MAG: sigma-70 family RNA polymerase sigma factor [Phycisphaerae bacterium]|nr:sigma-70 family RNA polymerase sigma factor [Phycisphaerae bacterium]